MTTQWRQFIERHEGRFLEIKESLKLPNEENGDKNLILSHLELFWTNAENSLIGLNESIRRKMMLGS